MGFMTPVLFQCTTQDNAVMIFSRCRNLIDIFLIMAVVDCGALTGPANGQVVFTSGTFGQTATSSCNTGYNLVGDSIHTCQSEAEWSGRAPTCQGMLLKGDSTNF